MKTFMHKLSSYEHHEIFNFPQIYFVGQNAKKKQAQHGGPNNEGFDDEQGSYMLVAHDHISYRYEIIKIIGKFIFSLYQNVIPKQINMYFANLSFRKGVVRPSPESFRS